MKDATKNANGSRTTARKISKATSAIQGSNRPQIIWEEAEPPHRNYSQLAECLARSGDLFRPADSDTGLLCLSVWGKPVRIVKAADLFPIIVDRIDVAVTKDGKPKGGKIDSFHLNAMLRSEVFLEQFPRVDVITKVPLFLPDFSLVKPGYNDGGDGFRIFYLNGTPEVSDGLEAMTAFLDVMEFASESDRTNAVAFALTVTLHNHFPGAKPISIVTASKSHAGKDTVILFASGIHRSTSISYQTTNWAFERNLIMALKAVPDTAVIVVENARLESQRGYIASAFLERFVTDPEPLLSAPGTGEPVHCRNRIVTAISTNFGSVSADLMNRGLPIHLEPLGDVAARKSPIGNPKLEYLPANQERIAAELRGMILRWKQQGCPLDEDVRHSFTGWAKTIGGILKVNGFRGFLGNYQVARTTVDPVRQHLGFLGAKQPDEWLTAREWARVAVRNGHKKMLIPPADQDSEAGQSRGMGVVLSAHQDETFETDTDTESFTLRLQKKRFRKNGGEPQVYYRFEVLQKASIPEDGEFNS